MTLPVARTCSLHEEFSSAHFFFELNHNCMKSDEGIHVIFPNNDARKNHWELALHVVMSLKRPMEAIDNMLLACL